MKNNADKHKTWKGLCVALLLGWVVFECFGCAAKPKEGKTIGGPGISAYQRELHNTVDRIVQLAAQRDALRGEVEKMREGGAREYETGPQSLRNILDHLQQEEDRMRRGNAELEKEMR